MFRNVTTNIKLSSNNLYLASVVCFCDIPLEDLKIHTSKYSRFGLSFEKDFVVRRGGSPVHYIPNDAKDCINAESNLKTVFDKMHDNYMKIRDCLTDEIRNFLYVHFFSYLKFFDHNLPDDDAQNYYFEREWRLHGELKFKIEDVKRVFIKKCYAKKFRSDFPDYYGQIIFLE